MIAFCTLICLMVVLVIIISIILTVAIKTKCVEMFVFPFVIGLAIFVILSFNLYSQAQKLDQFYYKIPVMETRK